jgi:WD40 repeat protein
MQKHRLLGLRESTTEVYFPYDGSVNCLCLDKIDERFLLCGTTNNLVAFYDTMKYSHAVSIDNRKKITPLRSGLLVNNIQSGLISSVDWYPNDCGIFVASSIRGVVKLYDTANFIPVLSFDFDGRRVFEAKFRPVTAQSYRSLVATGVEGGDISFCDVRTGDNAHTIHAHTSDTTGLDWSPHQEHHIVSCSRDGTTKMWDIRKAGNAVPIMVLDWSTDYGFVIPGAPQGEHNRPIFKKAHNEFTRAKAHESEVLAVRYSPCGQHIVTSAREGCVRVWSACSGNILLNKNKLRLQKRVPYRLEIASFPHPSDNLLFLPGGIDSSGVGNIDIVQLYSGVGGLIKSLKGHWDHVESVVYANHSQRLFSASRDGMILEWKYDNDRQTSANGILQKEGKCDTNKKCTVSVCERQTGLWFHVNTKLNPFQNFASTFSSGKSNTFTRFTSSSSTLNSIKREVTAAITIKNPKRLTHAVPLILRNFVKPTGGMITSNSEQQPTNCINSSQSTSLASKRSTENSSEDVNAKRGRKSLGNG